jgi:hypothetical protein
MPGETWVWIAQCLCLRRHCICAGVDEAADELDAEIKIAAPLREELSRLIESGGVNPWCGICHAPRETWHFELGRSRWTTLAEAAPEIHKIAAEQAATGAVFGELLGAKPRGRMH